MDTQGVRVKNTFVDVEEPFDWELEVRRVRTAPSLEFSLPVAGGEREDKVSVKFAEVLEEVDFEMEETNTGGVGTSAADEDSSSPVACKLPSMRTPQTPGSKPTRSALKSSRCRAVMFWTPQEPSRLEVKNTFLNLAAEDEGSPIVRASKSVPVAFRPVEEDAGSELSLSPTGDEAEGRFGDLSGEASPSGSPVVGRVSTAKTPTVCHLRTLSFNSANPAGPHLGLLWAPSGQAWAPEMFGDARGDVAPRPPPPTAAASPVVGSPGGGGSQLWELSRTAPGCREVQAMLEDAASDEERGKIADHLRGNVMEALTDPYANYVVTKVIATLPPERFQFILDEMDGEGAVQAAKHKFGCRIVQRLIERCPPAQVQGIVRAILDDFDAVARHPYGNYVQQNLLENGTEEQKSEIVERITKDIQGLSADTFGTTVVGAALAESCAEERRLAVARALASHPGLMTFVACKRHGHVAVVRALQVLQGAELEAARAELLAEAESLQASRFGRNVAAVL